MSLLNTLLFLGLALSQTKLHASANGISDNSPAEQKQSSSTSVDQKFIDDKINLVPDIADVPEILKTNYHLWGRHSLNTESESGQEPPRQPPQTDIIIVATVDGTIAAIDSASGDILWKQVGKGSEAHLKLPRESDQQPEDRLLQPLISTTTTATSARHAAASDMTAAIPSIDGSVFITSAASSRDARARGERTTNSMTKTDITTLQDLVARAPYVDSNGLFYVGSRHSTVAAIDRDTGEVLYVASADSNENNNNLDNPEWQNRNVVWIGRVDHSVSIYDATSSTREVQFSAAKFMSVTDMIPGKEADKDYGFKPTQGPLGLSRLTEGPPITDDSFEGEENNFETQEPLPTFSELVATPSGNLAYRNPDTGRVEWVADEAFETPIAYAIHSSSGKSLAIDIIPDVTMPSQSREYLIREIERQIHLTLDCANGPGEDCEGPNCGQTTHPPIVGTLQNGQLYAMPLGKRQKSVYSARVDGHNLALDAAAVNHHHTAASSSSMASINGKHGLAKKMPLAIGRQPLSQHQDDRQNSALNRACGPSSPFFPGCLISAASHKFPDLFQEEGPRLSENKNDFVRQSQSMDAVAIEAYQQYHGRKHGDKYTHSQQEHQNYYIYDHQRPRSYRKTLRILGSWLPPTIALIFVVSFELGRRKRQKDNIDEMQQLTGSKSVQFNESAEKDGSSVDESRQVIQITDQVLGYGGHGTVVYRGTLEGRNVAVKRMLKTYLASADREISLLIESDGHPNVVRYFLKEVKGDFVYLALELCDLSLHGLIATLGSVLSDPGTATPNKESPSKCISKPTKEILLQIAAGVKHLHSLRIVHNDLKPANILLALSKKVKSPEAGNSNEAIFNNFQKEYYIAKISDMGLGKMLAGHSSFGTSALADGSIRGLSSNGNVGMGPGTVGWMAPEQMKRRISAPALSDASHSGDASSIEKPNFRASRSVDIFSLGCIFYSTLIPGLHPFGEWYEREANIMYDRPSIEALEYLSIEAYDLVASMIQHDPRKRPNAKEICEHPFFWTQHKKIAFICDLSDRLEIDSNSESEPSAQNSAFSSHPLAIERNAIQVVGLAWDKSLYKGLTEQKYRTYDPTSIRDLLRLMRNKKNHFQDLEGSVRQKIGSDTDGLMEYFESCFPKLLMHCYRVCCDVLPLDDPLVEKYSLTVYNKVRLAPKTSALSSLSAEKETPSLEMEETKANEPETAALRCLLESDGKLDSELSTGNSLLLPDGDPAQFSTQSLEGSSGKSWQPKEELEESLIKEPAPTVSEETETLIDGCCTEDHFKSTPGSVDETAEPAPMTATKQSAAQEEEFELSSDETKNVERSIAAETELDNVSFSDNCTSLTSANVQAANAEAESPANVAMTAFGPVASNGNMNEGFVLWEGSTAAKTLNCRGWIRSDEEWVNRASSCNRKQAAILAKCAEDPKFRTRLCNHWDISLGTSCPMRRKNKCVFAHGPVELRVKEAKRNRWGKLVDKNGNNSNAKSSGGEDTYGAANSIETARKGEGKWIPTSQNVKQKNGAKKQVPGIRKKPKAAASS